MALLVASNGCMGEKFEDLVTNSSNDVHSGSEGKKYGGGGIDTLGKEPYQFEPTGTEDNFVTLLCDPAPTI